MQHGGGAVAASVVAGVVLAAAGVPSRDQVLAELARLTGVTLDPVVIGLL